jgi:hypothetical protein
MDERIWREELTFWLVQAQNITWQNFHVENVTFPIYVTQSYVKQVPLPLHHPG